jgi:E3 ubiquitin-protein ligase UBR7
MSELEGKTPATAPEAAPVTGKKRERGEDVQQQTTENGAEQQDADDDEVVLTLSEVLKHDEHMTETADAVLGDASDTHCSYPMGYMRQAIYACMTCTPDATPKPETRAGVCLACTYSCHQDHELVELYTKRAFRCDCGNSKFPASESTFAAMRGGFWEIVAIWLTFLLAL